MLKVVVFVWGVFKWGLVGGCMCLLMVPALWQTFRRKMTGCRAQWNSFFFFVGSSNRMYPTSLRGSEMGVLWDWGVSRSLIPLFFLSFLYFPLRPGVYSVPPDSLRDSASVTEARGDQMGTLLWAGPAAGRETEEGEGVKKRRMVPEDWKAPKQTNYGKNIKWSHLYLSHCFEVDSSFLQF